MLAVGGAAAAEARHESRVEVAVDMSDHSDVIRFKNQGHCRVDSKNPNKGLGRYPNIRHADFGADRVYHVMHNVIPISDEGMAEAAAPQQELFEGGCHCRAVRFRVAISKFDDALDCNCSICTMKGIGAQCNLNRGKV